MVAQLNLGMVLIQKGDYAAAVDQYRRIIVQA